MNEAREERSSSSSHGGAGQWIERLTSVCPPRGPTRRRAGLNNHEVKKKWID
jgi:hypothetical protein